MVKVLFVCLGNICRSPMAEAIFRHLVKAKGLEAQFEIDSAGTGSWHAGETAHEGTLRILNQHKISHNGRARVITDSDLTYFDYIITMDDHNLRDVQQMGFSTAVINPLLAYAPELGTHQVPDPYYNGRYERVYELCSVAYERLLETIVSERNVLAT